MNDINFSNSFHFNAYSYSNFSYTDNTKGAPSHYFAYMTEGSCKLVTETETVKISKGDIFYIPDRCSYQSYWYGEPEIRFISLGFHYLPNFEHKIYPPQVIFGDKKSVKLFLSLAEEGSMSAKTIGVFYTLVGRLLPKMIYTGVCRTREIVAMTEEYLNENPRARVPELAQHCAISEAALYSAFKKASGSTPNDMRNRILLEKAKEMLISTDKTVESISDFYGFSSASYFRKKFGEYFNTTPTKMRKKYRV